jgi:hypothetical protein
VSIQKILVAIFSSLACLVHAGEIQYDVRVDVRQKEGCSFLSIEYKNTGDGAMYFQPEEPAVLLMNSHGKVLPSTGIIAKRPPYSIEEHVKLMPGHVFLREINLNSSYGLKKKGRYIVSVNIDYFDPVQVNGYQKGSVSKSFFYAGKCQQNKVNLRHPRITT